MQALRHTPMWWQPQAMDPPSVNGMGSAGLSSLDCTLSLVQEGESMLGNRREGLCIILAMIEQQSLWASKKPPVCIQRQ